MSSWRDEYNAALQLRDLNERRNAEFYQSYTKLADRAATVESMSPVQEPYLKQGPESSRGANSQLTSKVLPAGIQKVREDLIEAQQNRVELQGLMTKMTEDLFRLQVKSKSENRQVSELLVEKQSLAVKLRDRDEELRGKAKLLEDVHDETVSLTLQLNMAEANNQKLQTENKELVDRWMARMAQEAEAMNVASKF
ncbi:hypothetical protein MMC14_009082 [Varicellaria rhodocarpa]|nr:hypothetical protein [Varicellaria rhodocarpa]